MTKSYPSAAARAFEQELRDLVPEEEQPELGEPDAFGGRSLLLGAADAAWSHRLRLLDRSRVQQLLGVTSRQAVSDQLKRDKLLAVTDSRGRLLFPAFQFRSDGRPYAAVRSVIRVFRDAGLSEHAVAAWFTTGQSTLGGATPAKWLSDGRDEKQLIDAARRTAARLAH